MFLELNLERLLIICVSESSVPVETAAMPVDLVLPPAIRELIQMTDRRWARLHVNVGFSSGAEWEVMGGANEEQRRSCIRGTARAQGSTSRTEPSDLLCSQWTHCDRGGNTGALKASIFSCSTAFLAWEMLAVLLLAIPSFMVLL
ncbi:hypothetical protein EYF80_027126 [Liparis tanakae]|uniref:Uncharacterized protein n=1 Tax=Liparis tanakae TaxID=230148 RepID=A0A4Z2HBN7_9TELE|nr:hypothetical protein EYF80_027126 [Liparis tanakae]